MNNLTYLCLVFLIFGCNQKPDLNIDNRPVTVYGSKKNELVVGQMKNDTIPIGLWTFYNNSGDLVLSLDYEYDVNQNLSLMIKKYEDFNKLNYSAFYEDGNLIEEKSNFDYQNVSFDNGRNLYKTFIKSFFVMDKAFMKNAKSIKKEELLKKLDSLREKHKRLPIFTMNEIESILLYLKNPSPIVKN